MIHDGNRPLVSDEIIADSLAVCKVHNSAVAAIPCVEAIYKSADGIESNVEKRFKNIHIIRCGYF